MSSAQLRLFLSLAAVGALAGCAGTALQTGPVPATVSQGQSSAARGGVAVNIQWPYRTQLIPTSTQRLHFAFSGPTTTSFDLDRPPGAAPTSIATFSLPVGVGYGLAIQALAASPDFAVEPNYPIAAGQSAAFDVKTNKLAPVTVTLDSFIMPVIATFSPTAGGPGTLVTVTGAHLGADRGLASTFTFGGVPSNPANVMSEGTASVAVPVGAHSGGIAPVADGVMGLATGSFTVLSALTLQPLVATASLGSTCSFTVSAVTDAGQPFPAPPVTWSLTSTILPDPMSGKPAPSMGHIDSDGMVTADGATGSAIIQVYSGSLMATASIEISD